MTRSARSFGVLVVAMAAASTRVPAQLVLYACYVPNTGTVYRIKTSDTSEQCKSNSHVQFSWTDAVGADHGSLTGLGDDDHLLYLRTNGVRNATNGFAVTGTYGTGAVPTSGAGVRLMWYPAKAAFRAGAVDGLQWDDQFIGNYSTAFGNSTRATGANSTAMGLNTVASGHFSTAMGAGTTASGNHSTAMGANAHTLNQEGSFVYGDVSTISLVTPTGPNQFIVRAAGGTRFFSDPNHTAGVWLAPGAGAWAAISDVNRKEHFRAVDGEAILAKIARMPIQEWSYRAQDASIRHLGPTAQDFYASFGLGESDTTITTTDVDGVNLLGVQALERRTRTLSTDRRGLRAAVAALRAENTRQRDRLRALEARTAALEAVRADVAALRSKLEGASRVTPAPLKQ